MHQTPRFWWKFQKLMDLENSPSSSKENNNSEKLQKNTEKSKKHRTTKDSAKPIQPEEKPEIFKTEEIDWLSFTPFSTKLAFRQ